MGLHRMLQCCNVAMVSQVGHLGTGGGVCGWWLEDLTVGLLGCGSFQELEVLRPDCVVRWQKLWDDKVSKQEQQRL